MQNFNFVIFGDKFPWKLKLISFLKFFRFLGFLLIFSTELHINSTIFGWDLALNSTRLTVETTDFRCGWISQKVGSGAKCRPHAVDLVGKPMGFERFWALRVLNFQTPLNFYGWIPGNVAQKHFKKHHLSNHPYLGSQDTSSSKHVQTVHLCLPNHCCYSFCGGSSWMFICSPETCLEIPTKIINCCTTCKLSHLHVVFSPSPKKENMCDRV